MGVLALGLAYVITRYAFRDIMETVTSLSEPNEKTVLLNYLFREITRLDQMQRAEASTSPEQPYNAFLNQTQQVSTILDSTMQLSWDSSQYVRLDSMKSLLDKRNTLFFSYLKLKSRLLQNQSLTDRIDTLSAIIEQKKVDVDTSVVTTQKKTTTTYLPDTIEEEKKVDRNLFRKLFGKKNKGKEDESETTRIRVLEELSVSIDTLAVITQSKALEEVEQIVQSLAADQRLQRKNFLRREVELLAANDQIMNELMDLLREVELEEYQAIKAKNADATTLINRSISRISWLLIGFILGGALLVYLVWVDITRSKYYREELERSRDEAQELSQIKQRFLANMSHEIRTPLQSILGFSEQLKGDNHSNREAAEAIHSSSEHLLHIVNEVLDYSRISSGNFVFANEPFSLMKVIREVESSMRIQAEKKNLTFLVDFENASDHILVGDPFRLKQVLYNLIGNAIKFTTKGFVKLVLQTAARHDTVHCTMVIQDSGIGIRKEDLQKIFNQFEQANPLIAGQFGGTGLGLTIVKSLIEAQGGKLEVDSTPGQGSEFKIEIEFKTTHVKESLSQPSILPSRSTQAKKVVVVDDDPTILKLCGIILKKYNIPHMLYNDSAQLAEEGVPDDVSHVLMDIRMPKISGTELCKMMREKYSADLILIALTAHVFPQDKQALLDIGFTHVLSKPFHEKDLLDLLGHSKEMEIHPSNGSTSAFDLSGLKKLTLGDEDLLQSILQQFIEETQKDLQHLEEKVKSFQAKSIREIIHRLSGRTSQMGMLALGQQLREVETKLVNGVPPESLLDEIRILQNEVHHVVCEIEQLVETG